MVLSVTNRLIDVQLERMDVVIRIGPLKDSELVARRIATFELWPCASPTYLAHAPSIAQPSDLSLHRPIAHSEQQESWDLRRADGECQKVDLVGRHVIPEPVALKSMLIGHAGIGLLPDFEAADALATGQLRRVLPEWSAGSVEAHALYPSHRSLSAKVRVFVDALVNHFAR